ncbi:alpha-ribazole phosphatase CobZ [Methanothermobacter sp. K4]|uniref:alpha-ribazole phosphatase CobZ n=1 Tax=Methanothermobacter sp. K4 TaxID=2913262 RepID=UPI001ED9C98F|nr:alpha-ribazole phosphatase CobZ [Methanothermobacter sp. K4]MCG2828220.1 alpha-ribazole phosphatase CobZ [Methanothermobacter sp. K4]
MNGKLNLNGTEIVIESDLVRVSAESGLITASKTISTASKVTHELPGPPEVSRVGNVLSVFSAGDFLDVLVVCGERCGDRIPEILQLAVREVTSALGLLAEILESRVTVVSMPGDEGFSASDLKKSLRLSSQNMLLEGPRVEELLELHGVTAEAMVEAGMELVVGAEVTDELRERLRSEINRALGDLNVRVLLAAALHIEDDIRRRRLLGVDLTDDPAYLYSDEVMGMAVANQVAGTKAIFNFKRYDEEKPGVIGDLGPMVDDAVAGLIAGCMSRLFE